MIDFRKLSGILWMGEGGYDNVNEACIVISAVQEPL